MVGDSDIGPGYSHLESIARVPSLNRLILGLLLAQPERLHLRDVLIHDAQFPRSLAGELQLEVHDRVVALILVVELQFVAFGLGEEERRWAVFHLLRFHQFALVVEGDAAGVQRPRDFLAGLHLQHQEDFPSCDNGMRTQTLKLEIPNDLEAGLLAQARPRGRTLEVYAKQVLTESGRRPVGEVPTLQSPTRCGALQRSESATGFLWPR